nr:nuclear fragile X mental retardation-interacting protein 1, conserved domain-containing protein [Tanacetum cinerariifolium]
MIRIPEAVIHLVIVSKTIEGKNTVGNATRRGSSKIKDERDFRITKSPKDQRKRESTNSLTFPSIIVRETNPDVPEETVRKYSGKAVLETICSVLKDSGKAIEETSYSAVQDSEKAEEEEGQLTE